MRASGPRRRASGAAALRHAGHDDQLLGARGDAPRRCRCPARTSRRSAGASRPACSAPFGNDTRRSGMRQRAQQPRRERVEEERVLPGRAQVDGVGEHPRSAPRGRRRPEAARTRAARRGRGRRRAAPARGSPARRGCRRAARRSAGRARRSLGAGVRAAAAAGHLPRRRRAGAQARGRASRNDSKASAKRRRSRSQSVADHDDRQHGEREHRHRLRRQVGSAQRLGRHPEEAERARGRPRAPRGRRSAAA